MTEKEVYSLCEGVVRKHYKGLPEHLREEIVQEVMILWWQRKQKGLGTSLSWSAKRFGSNLFSRMRRHRNDCARWAHDMYLTPAKDPMEDVELRVNAHQVLARIDPPPSKKEVQMLEAAASGDKMSGWDHQRRSLWRRMEEVPGCRPVTLRQAGGKSLKTRQAGKGRAQDRSFRLEHLHAS